MIKLRVEPIGPISKKCDFKSNEIYNAKSGKAVSSISFSEVLHTVLIEDLREELHKCITLYGLRDSRTLRASQELDKALNKKSC